MESVNQKHSNWLGQTQIEMWLGDRQYLGVLSLEADEMNLCLIGSKVARNVEVNAVDAIEFGCTVHASCCQ